MRAIEHSRSHAIAHRRIRHRLVRGIARTLKLEAIHCNDVTNKLYCIRANPSSRSMRRDRLASTDTVFDLLEHTLRLPRKGRIAVLNGIPDRVADASIGV